RSETADIVQERVRDCRHSTGDGQRLQTYYRRRSETGHTTGDGQRLQTYYRRRSETADKVQETVRDCRQTYYRRRSETADVLQETVRDCRHGTTGDGQRLQTKYRRRS
ncbi:unnamed protein product, partial [Staurois parvus]